jgi:hypothetical protein
MGFEMPVREEAKTVLTGLQDFVIDQRPRRTGRQIVNAHHRADKAANGFGSGSDGEPFVQSATFVCLDVAKTDPAQPRRWDQRADGVAHRQNYLFQAGMEKQRLIVQDKKLIKLQVAIRHV